MCGGYKIFLSVTREGKFYVVPYLISRTGSCVADLNIHKLLPLNEFATKLVLGFCYSAVLRN